MTVTAIRAHTHDVVNQPPDLGPRNLFDADVVLRDAVMRGSASWGLDRLRDLGEVAGSEEAQEHGRRAEANPPKLRTHDQYGHRIDEVECDPSWHWLLSTAVEREIHSLPWRDSRPGAHAIRGAMAYLWIQVNGGTLCPICMTFSAVPTLREFAPDLAEKWVPRLTKPDYATGALAGQALTEKQAGTDLRATMTRAEPLGDGSYEMWGHKWFCSAPMCDVFLALARAPEGLTCFLVERGPGMELVRLKDKLGTRSLPSSEVEFRGARAWPVGEPGRGVATIVRNLTHARIECMIGATASIRGGLIGAYHHTRHREAFGARLIDQPAMRNVIADLALESEAATTAMMNVCDSYDDYTSPFRRIAITVMKYWICKRAPAHAAEALECLGGNGYIEDSGMALVYRDSPVNSIWEGPGNVMALDVLRAMAKDPDSVPAFIGECEQARGADRRFDQHLDRLKVDASAVLSEPDPQFIARRFVEDLALAFQAGLLLRHAPPAVADAFCAARLSGGGRVYGTLPPGVETDAIIARVLPE